MKDFVTHTTCVTCGQDVELRVPAPLDPFYILKYFMVDLGSKCKTCLEKANAPDQARLQPSPEADCSSPGSPKGTPAERVQIGNITLVERRAPGDAEAEVQRRLMEQEANNSISEGGK